MKFLVAFIAFAVIIASFTTASPIDQDDQGHGVVRANRMRRVTCDLLSLDTPYGSLNHSACAAHCLALRRGFRGGRCIDGVCNCRK